jgi:hypothetical protein
MSAIKTDIFGRLPLEFGGAFAADAAVCAFGGQGIAGGVGLLTQQLSFQYQQQITRLYEVGSRKTFYVAGRSQGNANIARVLGPRPVSAAFYALYGDVCNAANNTLVFGLATGCELPGDLGAQVAFTLLGCVITSIGITVAAENMIVNENLTLMYVALLAD